MIQMMIRATRLTSAHKHQSIQCIGVLAHYLHFTPALLALCICCTQCTHMITLMIKRMIIEMIIPMQWVFQHQATSPVYCSTLNHMV